MTIAINTKTTMSNWVQSQNGDTRPAYGPRDAVRPYSRWQ